MKANLSIKAMTAVLWLCVGSSRSLAAIFPVNSPGEISGATTINFDGYPDLSVANTLFQVQGITFTRDDGQVIFLVDWTAQGWITTSPDNVLATIRAPGASSYVTHLNVLSSSPVFAIGAYFGNDQVRPEFPAGDFSAICLSAYDPSDQLLGAVVVAANHNTHVDQFIGIGSDLPISRVTFENLSDSGVRSQYYAMTLDDLVFAPVPEPSTFALWGIGTLSFLGFIRAKRKWMRTNETHGQNTA